MPFPHEAHLLPNLHRALLNVPLRTAGPKIYNPPLRDESMSRWGCTRYTPWNDPTFQPSNLWRLSRLCCTVAFSGLLTCSSIVYFITMELLNMYDMHVLGTVTKVSSLWLADGGVHWWVNHEILQYCRTASSKRRWESIKGIIWKSHKISDPPESTWDESMLHAHNLPSPS